MKRTIWTSLFILSCSTPKPEATPAPAPAQAESPALWTAAEGCDAPESAHYHAASERIFVSNVAGAPLEKDGNGWISTFDRSGAIQEARWLEGLNAPKGLRISGATLWVADIDSLVEIDIETRAIKATHLIDGATILNDVDVDEQGVVFVSDTMGAKIYRFENGTAEVFVEGPELESPNGLLIEGDRLIVAAWGPGVQEDWSTTEKGRVLAIDLVSKEITPITVEPLGNLDGIEVDPGGGYLVSDFMGGKVFRVRAGAAPEVLFEGIEGAADIGLIGDVLLVPAMMKNEVVAHQL